MLLSDSDGLQVEPSSGASYTVGEPSTLPEFGKVFCDWLDVTFQPHEDVAVWLAPLVASVGGVLTDTGYYTLPGGGVIKHQIGKRWQRLSVSGNCLTVLRVFGLFDELLSCISRHPYKITRVDASLDLPEDGSLRVNSLYSLYKYSGVRLNPLNLLRVENRFNLRFDGVISGTVYVGNIRTCKVTARIYDKQNEVFCKHRIDIGSRLRVEITVRTDQVTLRDVSDPSAIFWHYAAPGLLPAPVDFPKWSPGNPYLWEPSKIVPLSIQDRLRRVIYDSGDLNAAMAICGDSIDMFSYLGKLVSLRLSERASRLPGWRPSYES